MGEVLRIGRDGETIRDGRHLALLPADHFGDLQVGQKVMVAGLGQFRVGADLAGNVEIRTVVAAAGKRQ